MAKQKKKKNSSSDKKKISPIEILVKESYISKEDAERAAKHAGGADKKAALDFLYQQEVITPDIFGQAMAEYYKVNYADLNTNIPDKEQVLKIPEDIAKKYHAVLYEEKDNQVVIATYKPKQKGLKQELKKVFPKKKIQIAYSLKEDIESVMVNYREKLETSFAKILESENEIAPEIVDQIISDALALKASDIHFDPQKKEVVVRFRVDGVMQEAGRIPKKHYHKIVNRVKIQSHLRIDQHAAPQDGAMRFADEDAGSADLRVSIAPTVEGEKIVLRILAKYVQNLSVGALGLDAEDQEILEKASKKPFGMILTVGPTGSGKTTTLYGLLKEINDPKINIITIEDPVEYKITGVNHIQVNPETNLTFARGLRTIVRQDPDVILVGEIRDSETAEIAVNAALTGHLLFSTFHANDASTAIPRLLEMGVESFLLASTLELVVSQRLVRRICESCRTSYKTTPAKLAKKSPAIKKHFSKKQITLYKGKGCEVCGHTGYRGRVGVFELIQVTSEMQELILTSPSSSEVKELARKQGSKSMFEDALEKVEHGVTTISEVLRVVAPDKKQNETKK